MALYQWWSQFEGGSPSEFRWSFLWEWDWKLLGGVSLGTLSIVALGCAIKYMELHAGGAWVAEFLGGQRLDPSSPSEQARMFLNIVEEMAIASGMAAPPVYILDREKSVNAFAAGYSPEDAVIGVTRGAVNLLTREELQGVIAHEFSHILNGDMRLNMEMIGLLNGIQGLSMLGRWMIQQSTVRSFNSDFVHYGHGIWMIGSILIGGAFIVVGSIGVLFGSLIKAAVSRQREFLADASAVQFTRNPQGLANALKKIGGFVEGSAIHHYKASEVSHMFFSQAIFTGLDYLFATHPRLIDRIRQLDPSFSGMLTETEFKASSNQHKTTSSVAALIPGIPQPATSESLAPKPTPENLMKQVGEPTPEHVVYAHTLLENIPDRIRQAIHEPFGARAVIYALLLSHKSELRQIQKNRLSAHADSLVYQETLALEDTLQSLAPVTRLPLLDMAIPTLRQLSSNQYNTFKTNVTAIIPNKDKEAFFGWILRRVLLRHLDPYFSPTESSLARYSSLKRITNPCVDLLSALAHQGNGGEGHALLAFKEGKQELGIPHLALRPTSTCTLAVLDLALYTLAGATPQIKRKILKACAACVLSDNYVTIEQGELLRAIADSLGCPMPPLLSNPIQAES